MLKAFDEAEQVVGIMQLPQDTLVPTTGSLMSHFISFVLSIYIHMVCVLFILTVGLEEQSATSFSVPSWCSSSYNAIKFTLS
jgi:hypothetical protein